MAGTPTTYTGEAASIWIYSGASSKTHTALGISDFSLTLDKGVVEQELVGEAGNYRIAGSLSAELSLTHCKLDQNAAPWILGAVVKANDVVISGNAGTNSLHFYLVSCAVTGFDLSMGDADTISEGSVDFTLRTPYDITRSNKSGITGAFITNT